MSTFGADAKHRAATGKTLRESGNRAMSHSCQNRTRHPPRQEIFAVQIIIFVWQLPGGIICGFDGSWLSGENSFNLSPTARFPVLGVWAVRLR
jgi:hypothetical protein